MAALKYIFAVLLIAAVWAVVLLLGLPMWIAIVSTVVIVAVLATFVIVKVVRARKAAKEIERALKAQADRHAASARPDLRADIESMQQEFLRAIAALKGTLSGDEYVFDGNPVHCWEGQQLAATGNVGISMFSHLHFQVHLAARENGRATKPVKFSDVSVAIHEGRCFSMRKYRADNVDRGPVQVR